MFRGSTVTSSIIERNELKNKGHLLFSHAEMQTESAKVNCCPIFVWKYVIIEMVNYKYPREWFELLVEYSF